MRANKIRACKIILYLITRKLRDVIVLHLDDNFKINLILYEYFSRAESTKHLNFYLNLLII